ncbi:MAG TPA: hypothetical protein VKJ07_22260 [Mycobacteriales bacterium]|nr:hypothetical protein [Mycobacteriales bacterium]
MTSFDYALNIGLIALVVLQMRGRRLDRRGVVLPLALVGWAASQYLHGIPTAGNDGLLVTAGVMAGLILGSTSAAVTTLAVGQDGVVVARATLAAAALWVVGVGARMGFSLFMQHGGAPTVIRFSEVHRLTGAGWVTAMVLMALVEVVSRTLILVARSWALNSARQVGVAVEPAASGR